MRRLAVLLALAAACAAAPSAGAAVLLGVYGSAARMQALTGERPAVGHVIVGFGQAGALPGLLRSLGPVPMIGLNTVSWPSNREVASPRAIALGQEDAFLVALNRAAADRGRTLYVRPFGEMNGHWNAYSAFDAGGRPRDAAHSTRWFRRAFARVYLVVHGDPAADAKLRRLGLPPVRGATAPVPFPTLRVVWNPQGYGSPDVPGNSAQAYYPGDAYVDVVGDDLYDMHGKAEWGAAEALYRAHPGKPFAFPEWGLWGIDDPAFVQRMAAFVRGHRRVEMIGYYGSRPGGTFDLASKPRSLAAYRRLIVPLAVDPGRGLASAAAPPGRTLPLSPPPLGVRAGAAY